jgi:uncharacterized protein YggE
MNRYRAGLFAASLLAGIAAAGPSVAQAPTIGTGEGQLSIVGEGIVRGRPDMALITLGVVSEAETAREALSENSTSMTGILEALREAGMQSRDLQTSGFAVDPIYSQPPPDFDGSQPFDPKIVGYRVRNDLTLRIRALDQVGTLLDKVVTLGANSISGPTFGVADPAPLEDQARRAAMRDALRKGALYAQAANVTLGPIVRIEENVYQAPPPLPMAAMAREAAADAPPPPIEGGELTFQAQVSVSWRLGD